MVRIEADGAQGPHAAPPPRRCSRVPAREGATPAAGGGSSEMVARLAGGGSEAPLGPSPRVKWSFHVLSNTVSLTDGLEWQKGKPSLAQWQIGKENFPGGK